MSELNLKPLNRVRTASLKVAQVNAHKAKEAGRLGVDNSYAVNEANYYNGWHDALLWLSQDADQSRLPPPIKELLK